MDIALDENGDIYVQPKYVDGPELVRQRIENRLKTHRGEYILDTRQGLPYVEWLAAKPAPLEQIADAVRFEIETAPGVARLVDFSTELRNRVVHIDATALLESDEQIGLTVTTTPADTGITRVRIA